MAESTLTFVGEGHFAAPNPSSVLDVVFVHGLGGDPFATWRYGEDHSNFWPRWLAHDLGNTANIWTAGYDSGVFASALAGEGPSIIDRATILLDFIIGKKLGDRKIVFVTHSLGGLIVKQMLRKCADAASGKRKQLLDAVAGISFMGTPHQGAGGATVIKTILQLLASKNVQQLAYGDDQLIDLGEWFRNWASGQNLPVSAHYETEKTKGVMIVNKVTANPNVFGCDPSGADGDHISMVKPPSRHSQIYVSISNFIQEIIEALGPTGTPQAGTPSTGETPPTETPNEDRGAEPALCPEILDDYKFFTTMSPQDRRPIEKKLSDAGREYEIGYAERKKERFMMALEQYGEQPSSLIRYTHLMSDVETRFNRHAMAAIARGGSIDEVNEIVQEKVIDKISSEADSITSSQVENAIYYLTGNCHIRWDNEES